MSSKRSRLLVPNILVDGFERDIQESCIYARAPEIVERKVLPCKGCKSGKVGEHNGIRCRVMDWETGKPVLFMPPFEFKPIETNSGIRGGRNDIE